MRRAEDLSLLCLSPASNPHLYSELVPEGTFQKQQACPAQTTQRHGSLMQFHFCHGQPLPETPPVSAVTREGPAWQVRAAGQGAASSTDPGFLTCWPSEEQRRAERSTSTTGVGQGPTLGGPFRSRRPLLRSFHGLLSQLSDRSPLPWAGAGPGTPVIPYSQFITSPGTHAGCRTGEVVAQREPASQAPVVLCVTIYKPLRAVPLEGL